MIAILDYGAGNLRSVHKAFEFLGHTAVVTSDVDVISSADRVVLPGVGAFGDAMRGLENAGLHKVALDAINSGRPFLGICVGLQLLFEESEESPGIKGLGIFEGKICKIPDKGLKIPQMGWNSLEFQNSTPLFDGLKNGEFMYFVHSFYPVPKNAHSVISSVTYGARLDVAFQRDNVFATQFHPEKSGRCGLKILDNFANL